MKKKTKKLLKCEKWGVKRLNQMKSYFPQGFNSATQDIINNLANDILKNPYQPLHNILKMYSDDSLVILISKLAKSKDGRLISFFMKLVNKYQGRVRETALNAVIELNWADSQKSLKNASMERCVAAYATLDRPSGKCGLIIMCEKGFISKELELHTFILNFNHEGIKKYNLKKIPVSYKKHWEHQLNGYIEIEFSEALSLLQDAYGQNIKFCTKPAREFNNYKYLLEYEIEVLDRSKLLKKLLFENLTSCEFANVYIAALKRLDYPLLYDLSSFERKKRLGKREDFMLFAGEDLSRYIFLKSKVQCIEEKGVEIKIKAFIIISTPQDEIMKINYELVLNDGGDTFWIDVFQEVSRKILDENHPENPMNYRVFCSLYVHSNSKGIKKWLENNSEIFLTGEFEKGVCYKLLKPEGVTYNSFDVTNGVVSEFILTEKELIVYAPKAINLAKMENLIAQSTELKVLFKRKYYFPVRELYKAAISGEPLEMLLKTDNKLPWLKGLKSRAALIYWNGDKSAMNVLTIEATYKLQLNSNIWYFLIEKKHQQTDEILSLIEYYVSGDWVWLNIYKGEMDQQINKLCPHSEVVYEYEFRDYYDLFISPVNDKRKWKIYDVLRTMAKEAPALKAMGMVPDLKETARKFKSLVKNGKQVYA
ncbi:MAG: hypothetical protein PHI90_04730 [Clostridia bacterium]|nr:hypothetical protein [Clostridia bacterium]MDD4048118.1 hypothetical protein [Clostridia bacterium]